MKKFTTLVDIRQIMKLHTDDKDAEDISTALNIDLSEVSRVIDAKFPKKKTKKVKTEE